MKLLKLLLGVVGILFSIQSFASWASDLSLNETVKFKDDGGEGEEPVCGATCLVERPQNKKIKKSEKN